MALRIRSVFKWLFIAISLTISLLLVTVMALMLFGVTVDLDFLKGGVESSASAVLERKVTIEGPAVLEFSDWPAIEVRDVRIANVTGASKPFLLNAEHARLQIALFPLFKGEIRIGEITAENVSLNLENDAQGKPNWVLGSEQDTPPTPATINEESETTPTRGDQSDISFGGLNDLKLRNIAVTYHDASIGKTVKFKLGRLYGAAAPGKPISIDFKGKVQKQTYDLELQGDTIEELLTSNRPWGFKLSGNILGKKIHAMGDTALRNNSPQANLDFTVKDIDVGAVLSALGLIDGLRASTGSMAIKLSLNGKSLKEIVQQSTMAFSVNNGQWRIESPTSDAYFDITGLAGGIFVERGNALTMRLEGMVDTLPVKFVITGAPLVEYMSVPETVPLTIDAEFAENRLRFAGELKLPMTSRDLSLALSFDTEKLDNLNEVLKLDLPQVGPISFDAKLHLQETGYDLPTLDLQIGKSRLEGKMSLDLSQEKPKANIELISELLRIDDIDFMKKTPEEDRKTAESPETEGKEMEDKTAAEEPEKQTDKGNRDLLSPDVLSSFNAEILVKAKEVISGEDRLGSGLLQVSVKDSRLAVEPLRINVPGGKIEVAFDYMPAENEVTTNLAANMEKFDIGVLTRRVKPESDMGGSFTLDAALHSTSPDLNSMMEHANGHFDFALMPQNFSAGIIDLWAVNLLSAIMTEVSEKEQSQINCVVVRFGIEEGFMEEKAIYMDTSNMRVSGRAEIDFEFKELDIMLAPKAKNPEFFSLAVPIKIEGNFEDFGLGIGLIRLTGSLVSFITSPIHVPIRRIFVAEIPEDGQEACRQAWTITGEEK